MENTLLEIELRGCFSEFFSLLLFHSSIEVSSLVAEEVGNFATLSELLDQRWYVLLKEAVDAGL